MFSYQVSLQALHYEGSKPTTIWSGSVTVVAPSRGAAASMAREDVESQGLWTPRPVSDPVYTQVTAIDNTDGLDPESAVDAVPAEAQVAPKAEKSKGQKPQKRKAS